MKKKVLTCLLGALCCAFLASCGNNNTGNEGKDPLTGEELSSTVMEENTDAVADETHTTESGDEFDRLLRNPNDVGGVVGYITDNIATATEGEITRFFHGLFHYGDDLRSIDYTQFDESKQYLPEDMIAYMELMKLENQSPSMRMSDEENRKVIGLTLSEMLERALLFEQHIAKYPNALSTEAASMMYEEIATHAITGGYDPSNGIEHYYQGNSADVVDEESIRYYQQFADANPDSRLAGIVKEYITLLRENNFRINEEIEAFYKGLYIKLFPTEL